MRMKKSLCLVTLLSGTALATAALAQTDERAASPEMACDNLVRIADENADRFQRAWVDGARAAAERGDLALCAAYTERAEEALGNDRTAEAGSRIVVEQPEPRVTVQQDAPDITVRQNDPQVSVDQGQPEIIVRQAEPTVQVEVPPPTITLHQPEPEIIVRMPEPNVDVAAPQPDISVSQNEPVVTVEQAEPSIDILSDDSGAAVEITRDQPVVHQQEAAGAAQVDVQRAEPNVVYEAAEPNVQVVDEGTPNVQFTESGEPEVTIERTNQRAEQATPDQGGAANPDQATAQTADGDTQAEAPAADPAPLMQVSSLLGRDVQGAQGEALGTLDAVVTDGNAFYAVLATEGGFLGLGGRNVAVPVSMVSVSDGGDALVASGLTEQDIEAMPDLDRSAVQELPEDHDVPMGRL